jgi:hypothetical protein
MGTGWLVGRLAPAGEPGTVNTPPPAAPVRQLVCVEAGQLAASDPVTVQQNS